MKRVLFLFFGIVLLVSLTACGGAPLAAPTATAVRPATAVAPNAQAPTNAAQARPTRPATATVSPTMTPTMPAAVKTTAPATVTVAVAAISTAGSLPWPEKSEAIVFAANATSAVVTPYLQENQPVAYQFTSSAGQIAYLAVAGSTNLQVFGPNKAPVSKNVKMPGYLALALTDAGNYTIVLRGRVNQVTLSLYLPPASSNLAGAAPLPEKPQVISLPVLPNLVYLPSRLDPAVPQAYTFAAQAGQVLSLAVTGNLTATVIAPDGNSLTADTDSIDTPWIFALPETGNYKLVLLGSGVVNVTARLTAAPTGSAPVAASQPGGISALMIASGQKTTSLRTNFISDRPQTYVLRLPANQVLYVNITGNAQVTQIAGPDQKPLALNNAPLTQRWSANAVTAGDYTITLSGSGPCTLTFSVPLPMP